MTLVIITICMCLARKFASFEMNIRADSWKVQINGRIIKHKDKDHKYYKNTGCNFRRIEFILYIN